MMGEQRQGGKGASWRALAATVPADHILRRIDRQLDMAGLRDALAPHYSRQGRPSIAPELLIRMAFLIGNAGSARILGFDRSSSPSCSTLRPDLPAASPIHNPPQTL
jgi:hypothetical protein